MTDLPFGLESKSTYAALSPTDLQSLGKRASVAYLSGMTSLNDAIIKLAREYPSISPYQVQRVVEFANQETFAKLFADNEKYASDKNIEFDVADPGVVLMELNNGARPAVMSAPADEYSSSPVKLGHSSVEADIELTRMFLGVDPALPGSESTVITKVAADGTFSVLDRVLPKHASAGSNPLDRILSTGHAKHANLVSGIAAQPAAAAAQPAPQGAAPAQGAQDNGASHNEQMLDLQREIELAKKRQELQKVEQQTLDAMNPAGQPGMVGAPGPAMPGQDPSMMGPAPDAGAAAAPAQPAGPVEAAPMPEQIPPAAAGAITAPPGGEPVKMGSALVKEAMAHVKSGRPHADLLLKAAEASVSLGAIKQATAGRGEYPHANPYGEVIRSKQKIAKLLDDCSDARGKNTELLKEASVRFQKAVAAHIWDGGNLGEVAHLMAGVNDNPANIKVAMKLAMDELVRQGIDVNKARAATIQYEMEKGASSRTPNLKHPIAEAYSDMNKLAEGTLVLNETWNQLRAQHRLVEGALQEAMVHASAR